MAPILKITFLVIAESQNMVLKKEIERETERKKALEMNVSFC